MWRDRLVKVAGSLVGAESAAIGEGAQRGARFGILDVRAQATGQPEMSGKAAPLIHIEQGFKDVTIGQAILDGPRQVRRRSRRLDAFGSWRDGFVVRP